MSFNDTGIAAVGRNDFRILYWYMNKSEAVNKKKKKKKKWKTMIILN